jgi:Tol biopolymer transport system component
MGEVYRARDARLGRDVAIKVLPESVARETERLSRFQREAKMLAALNHPNIASIYGFEDSGSVHGLVMELVEGPTLADRIAQGAIPIDEALGIAKQIAEAVEYAHERGIIHRDLKPANIKLAGDDAVKILDFGLAKALDVDASQSDMSNSPTITRMATQAGIILGTAAYMSPEQAKGKTVDRRTDIWAFGCVFYEMLTGKSAFGGETVTETLAAVIRAEPDWTLLLEDTPAAIRRLLGRCLKKDVRQRLQAIGDARIAIEEVIAGGLEDSQAPAAAVASPVPFPRWREMLPWGVAAILLIAAAVCATLLWRAASAPVRSVRSYILPPDGTSFAFAAPIGSSVISPDGTKLIFSARGSDGKQMLWVRNLDSLSSQPREGTQDGSFPFWSPDSVSVGFFAHGKLMKIDASGGPAETICDAGSARGGTWSANGVIVFAPKTIGGLDHVPAAGGNATELMATDKTLQQLPARWPEFLPDGIHFLYFGGSPMGPNSGGIYLGSLASGERTLLIAADSDALYASPGYLMFLRGKTLMAQPFGANGLKVTGDAFPIAEQVASPSSYRLGHFSVSEHGELVYDNAQQDQSQVTWLDASGKQLGTVGDPGVYLDLRISPNGKRLVETIGNSSTNDLWLMDLDREVRTRFTFDVAVHGYPIWSPDGTELAFYSFSPGNLNIYEKAANGTGATETLVTDGAPKEPSDWSRDGRFIAYWRQDIEGGGGLGVWILPMFGDRKPYRLLQTQLNELRPSFSPDGKWLAYSSNESGRYEAFIVSFPQPSSKFQVSSGGGGYVRWRADGKGLYFVSADNKMMMADVEETGGTLQIGATHTLFQLAQPSGEVPAYDVTSDGKKFLVAEPIAASGVQPVTLVTNWLAAVKKQ